jgi:hypothetical protein
MMQFHFYIPFLTALIPLVIGMIWYNKNVFGTAWMNATGMTEEKAKGANMLLIFIMTYVFSLFASFVLIGMTIHQIHLFSILSEETGFREKDPNSPAIADMLSFMQKYGNNFRTFKHGAFHGALAGILLALPVTAINSMFERRGFKYIAINAGYWIVCLALMGGVICSTFIS